ncbi:MAG: acyl carrier protein [Bacteroidia bacterium]|nr:acyl carrier protein [Bacteroidia bacterium]
MAETNKTDKTSIQAKVLEVIRPYVKDETVLSSLTGQTDIIKDLKINSARFVDILLDIEDAFEIAIDDSSAAKIITVEDAINVISDKLALKNEGAK